MNSAPPKLTAKRVQELFIDSLFKEGEPTDPHVEAPGVISNFGFHPARLEAHRAEVAEMLQELRDDFQEAKGGGMSFLNMCIDRHGNHWGEHPNMEQLCALAIGLGLGRYIFPREMWPALPGGVPYFVVSNPKPA